MTKKNITIIIGVGILMIGLTIFNSNNNKKNQTNTITNNINQNKNNINQNKNNNTNINNNIDNSIKIPTNPTDIVPGLYQNPIINTATIDGFKIINSKVENNEDINKKIVDDHLELTLKNISGKDISDFEVYYTITDTVTNQKEGYYKKLDGFVLKNNEIKSIHFDNKTGDGHFTSNINSLYYKSSNKMIFDVMVSTPGYKIETVSINKDAGGAELKD